MSEFHQSSASREPDYIYAWIAPVATCELVAQQLYLLHRLRFQIYLLELSVLSVIMPPKTKENADSFTAGLDGIKSIQESIVGETEKMNAIIDKMKADVAALSATQAEHTGIIEENTGRIKALESVKNHHDDRLLHVEEKIEKLERKQEFYQRLEDQDKKIIQIMKFIQPAEVTKS